MILHNHKCNPAEVTEQAKNWMMLQFYIIKNTNKVIQDKIVGITFKRKPMKEYQQLSPSIDGLVKTEY